MAITLIATSKVAVLQPLPARVASVSVRARARARANGIDSVECYLLLATGEAVQLTPAEADTVTVSTLTPSLPLDTL